MATSPNLNVVEDSTQGKLRVDESKHSKDVPAGQDVREVEQSESEDEGIQKVETSWEHRADDDQIRAEVETASDARFPAALPPTPPAKLPTFPGQPVTVSEDSLHILPPVPIEKSPKENLNGHNTSDSHPQTPDLHPSPPASASHRRSLTISQGHTVSVVLISSALETILASKDAKRSSPLRDSAQRALEMVHSGRGGDTPRVIFEPLRLACETRNEKLMIASLDCISKLISYSFFVETSPPTRSLPSPPPSPGPDAPPPSIVDLVANTITACHTESTPETVSLQIVKALLSLVLSSTTLVHHSSLLKAVRTVYNVFLLSTDPVNQTVAQGGLTQMVHHVFSRCVLTAETRGSVDAGTNQISLPRPSFTVLRNDPSLPPPSTLPPNRTDVSLNDVESASTSVSDAAGQESTGSDAHSEVESSSLSAADGQGYRSASGGPDPKLTL
jgi:brefeldin A-inhibited guanine nucleotide-exchange protein